MMAAIDKDGDKVDKIVADWMAKNEPTWKKWVDAGKG